ncbi:hypothetical protein FGO68_gene10300 [Halteria grandinella]|uniref:Uncharacterized protein n=1 Tax=Halteria grandinella TaxID=5974 RepID=A0A8J8T3W5_HALGN|nr:hypothetical protein FGO68_gene10300 [Halteria grandinella]
MVRKSNGMSEQSEVQSIEGNNESSIKMLDKERLVELLEDQVLPPSFMFKLPSTWSSKWIREISSKNLFVEPLYKHQRLSTPCSNENSIVHEQYDERTLQLIKIGQVLRPYPVTKMSKALSILFNIIKSLSQRIGAGNFSQYLSDLLNPFFGSILQHQEGLCPLEKVNFSWILSIHPLNTSRALRLRELSLEYLCLMLSSRAILTRLTQWLHHLAESTTAIYGQRLADMAQFVRIVTGFLLSISLGQQQGVVKDCAIQINAQLAQFKFDEAEESNGPNRDRVDNQVSALRFEIV